MSRAFYTHSNNTKNIANVKKYITPPKTKERYDCRQRHSSPIVPSEPSNMARICK
jgi:hypothetical protein